MTKKTVQPQDKYVLRLPDGMRERIRIAAEQNNRSMNAEIVARLESSLSVQDQRSTDEVSELKSALVEQRAIAETLRSNFQVLAEQLAGPVGENQAEVFRIMSALRTIGRVVPE